MKNILFIGSGYTTVWAYKNFVRNRKIKNAILGNEIQITIISKSNFHAFHGFTGEALSGVLDDSCRYTSISEIAPLANCINGEVTFIDEYNKRIIYIDSENKETSVNYCELVIGVGSYDKVDIPGIDLGHSVKEEGEITKIKLKLNSIIQNTIDKSQKEKPQSIVVIGGGFAGVEMVANIKEYIDKSLKEKSKMLNIYLINSSNRILPQISDAFPVMVNYAEKQLSNYNINVLNNCRVVEVINGGVILSNNETINSELVIKTLGQHAVKIKGLEKFYDRIDRKLITNKYLQVQNSSSIWAGGDVAKVMHKSGKFYCPTNALWAIKHGTWIGENLYRSYCNKPLREFNYYGLGQAASLGIGKGTNELYGIQMTGWIAWIVRFSFLLYFMPTRKGALNVVKRMFKK